jgi:transaldolase
MISISRKTQSNSARKELAMSSPLQSLIATGTKLWLDSVDPDLVKTNRALGATGATSNPIIISDLIKTGRFDDDLAKLLQETKQDDEAAWQLTDRVVRSAQEVFFPAWKETKGDDGYVSFELDPLLEDVACTLSTKQRSDRYVGARCNLERSAAPKVARWL